MQEHLPRSKNLPVHPCASSHRHPWLLATYGPSLDVKKASLIFQELAFFMEKTETA